MVTQNDQDDALSEEGIKSAPSPAPTLVSSLSSGRQWLFWSIFTVVFIFLLYTLRSVLLPFVAGIAIAYLLDPIADKCEKQGVGRAWATLGILFGALLVFIATFILLFPLLQGQVLAVAELAVEYSEKAPGLIERVMAVLQDRVSPEDMARLREGMGAIIGQIAGGLRNMVVGIISGGLAFISLMSLVFITPIVAFYLIRDWDKLVETLDGLLPPDHAPEIRAQITKIDKKLAGFIRGQTMVAAIQGVFYAVALTMVGLDFGLVIGVGAGLASFIPFVGSIGGLIVSVGMAIFQFGEVVPVLIVAAIFFAGQIIEGNFLTPKLVGDQVGLHPVWMIFALLTGGALLGVLGMLLAVPIAAVISVLVEFGAERYRNSGLYQNGNNAVSADDAD